MKKCSTCREIKDSSSFWKRSSSPDGLAYICKSCDSTRYKKMKMEKGEYLSKKQKEWRDNNKKRIRDTKRKSKYGVSGEEIDIKRAEQGYACAICKIHESKLGIRGLVIDHDHKTKIVRGLLCDRCNRSLGLLKENLFIIDSTALYLRKYQK